MAPYGRIRIALGAVAGTAATTEWVLAQTATTGPTAPPEASASGIGVLVLVALVAIVLAALITAVSLHDMKRQQEESAMILQARLSDALLLDPVSFFRIIPPGVVQKHPATPAGLVSPSYDVGVSVSKSFLV